MLIKQLTLVSATDPTQIMSTTTSIRTPPIRPFRMPVRFKKYLKRCLSAPAMINKTSEKTISEKSLHSFHFSEMVFSLVHVAFFVDISYEVSAWTESQEDDETTLQVYKFLIW